jgi:hypothetical protein
MRLLDKRLITLVGKFLTGFPGYKPTQLGRVVADLVKSGLPQFQSQEVAVDSKEQGPQR